jgi:phosphoglycolate phosphatase
MSQSYAHRYLSNFVKGTDIDAMAPPLRLVIFDCDGTIVDSQHTIVACMQAGFERHGLDAPEPNDIRRTVGLSLLEGIARLAPDHPVEMHEQLVDGYKHSFREVKASPDHHEALYPGMENVITRLDDQGYLLGVATGKSQAGLRDTLDLHGLGPRFMTMQTADINPGKPHPGMIESALRETGAEIENTVMIGDTTFDMEMARNAGALAIGVSWGYHGREEMIDAGAHVIVDHSDELLHQVTVFLGEKE